MRPTASVDAAARVASVGAFSMIAGQVCGKAVRDATFLSTLGVAALPRMVFCSALTSIVLAVIGSSWLARHGPRTVASRACVTSGLVFLLIWFVAHEAPAVAAVALYVHVSVGGLMLISWFWSVVNERFDPRTAKRRMTWIAGGGAAGGVAGGLIAGSALSVSSLLLVLAVLQFASAMVVASLRKPLPSPAASRPGDSIATAPADGGWTAGARFLAENSYLQNLAAFVLTITLAAALIDFLLKSQVIANLASGQAMLRFFAVFYSATGLMALALQGTLSMRFLERFGIARTAALLPAALGLGGMALILPGFLGVALASVVRGTEAVLRSSVFRTSYELFYTPISPRAKRATKTIVDVGFERLGDALGAGFIQLVLWASLRGAGGAVLPRVAVIGIGGVAAGLGVLGLWIARELGRGYIAALEQNLLEHAPLTRAASFDATTTAVVLQSMGFLPDPDIFGAVRPPPADRSATPAGPVAEPSPPDSITGVISELRSGDPTRVRRVLAGLHRPIDPELVPYLVRLLGWDPMAPDVIRTLRAFADELAEPLGEILADSNEEFAIRRRIPRVLSAGVSETAINSLFRGMRDPRFEVRYRCASALAQIRIQSPDLTLDHDRVLEAVCREARVDRRVWESHRLLDGTEPGEELPFVDEVLRKRTSRGLEHVFTLLSLLYPGEPLRIAFQGLHTDDPNLCGTALEYLESILPARVREPLWPLLEDHGKRRRSQRTREEILDSLLHSHASIQQNLEALRKKAQDT